MNVIMNFISKRQGKQAAVQKVNGKKVQQQHSKEAERHTKADCIRILQEFSADSGERNWFWFSLYWLLCLKLNLYENWCTHEEKRIERIHHYEGDKEAIWDDDEFNQAVNALAYCDPFESDRHDLVPNMFDNVDATSWAACYRNQPYKEPRETKLVYGHKKHTKERAR